MLAENTRSKEFGEKVGSDLQAMIKQFSFKDVMKGFRQRYLTVGYEKKKCDCLTHVLSTALPQCHLSSVVVMKVRFDYQATIGLVVDGRDIVWIPGSTTAHFIYVFGADEDAHMFSWAAFAQRYIDWDRHAVGLLETPRVVTHWPCFRTKRQLLVWLRKTLALPVTVEHLVTLFCPEIFLGGGTK